MNTREFPQGRDAAFVAEQLGHDKPAFTWRIVHLFRAAQQRVRLTADFAHRLSGGGVRFGVRSTP